MKTRIILGLAMIAAVVLILLADWRLERMARAEAMPARLPLGLLIAGLWAFVSVIACLEIARLGAAIQVRLLGFSAIAGSLAVATLPVWAQALAGRGGAQLGQTPLLVLLGLVTVVAFLEQLGVHRLDNALRQIALTCLAVLYLGAGGAIILDMRVQHGVGVLVLFLAAVKCADIGAYFTGSAVGRHKMIPWLSPGKSWEGLVGGLAAAAGTSVLATWVLRLTVFGSPAGAAWAGKAVIFGLVVGAAGQFADLCESLLKRSAGVKDSGALVPQFGGVLDIIDSPLLSAPFAAIMLELLK